MKRVLVTGASGFIGRHAVPRLCEKGYEVHCVTSGKAAAGDEAIIWHRTDLMDQVQSDRLFAEVRPTHLLHFAWYTEPGKF